MSIKEANTRRIIAAASTPDLERSRESYGKSATDVARRIEALITEELERRS